MKRKMRSQIISVRSCENECIMLQDLEDTQRSEKDRECDSYADIGWLRDRDGSSHPTKISSHPGPGIEPGQDGSSHPTEIWSHFIPQKNFRSHPTRGSSCPGSVSSHLMTSWSHP